MRLELGSGMGRVSALPACSIAVKFRKKQRTWMFAAQKAANERGSHAESCHSVLYATKIANDPKGANARSTRNSIPSIARFDLRIQRE